MRSPNRSPTSFNRRLQDEAFIAALLANLGRMALMKNEIYATACHAAGGWLTTAEQERAGFHTTGDEVAAEILLGWGLPPASRQRGAPSLRSAGRDRRRERSGSPSILAAADAAAAFIVADEDAHRWPSNSGMLARRPRAQPR